LHPGRVGILLNEGSADESRDNTPTVATSMGERIAHEVHATALP